jgi:nitronate monooxygenase
MLPPLKILDTTIRYPIIQGGMGIGISMARLSGEVGRCGGLGVVSSVALDCIVSKRVGKKLNMQEATAYEIGQARELGGACGINVMVALPRDYENSVRGAIDGGVDFIFSGAGLPQKLPKIVKDYKPDAKTGLVPIISSGKALNLVCRHWERYDARPAAAVLEGPMAGGHLGWKTQAEIDDPENRLEILLPPVLEVAKKYGEFPILVAGGVYTHDDIKNWLKAGAAGVQMGTRFLATHESGATDFYKEHVIKATADDIMVAIKPGSPCGYPFRILKNAPMWQDLLCNRRKPFCDKGYVMIGTACAAKDAPETAFCICNGLLASSGYNDDVENPIFTVGTNAFRVDKIVPVAELMAELTGEPVA